MKYIDAEKIKKYILDGLNNPDKKEAFGFDAVQILTEIEYMDGEDVKPITRGEWLKDKFGSYIKKCSNCGAAPFTSPTGEPSYSRFCPNCGAKMGEVK